MKAQCSHEKILNITYSTLFDMGLLLSSRGLDGRMNAMAVGWVQIGKAWNYPALMVAVRPTTYSYELIEETNEFTINIPRSGMREIVNYCGKVSGRIYDKFKETGITTERGINVNSPLIAECIAHYECKVILKSKVTPALMTQEIQKKHFTTHNYHMLYVGEILTALKDQ